MKEAEERQTHEGAVAWNDRPFSTKVNAMCILLQHPSASVRFDPPPPDPRDPPVVDPYPQTPESITKAYIWNCVERRRAGVPLLPAPPMGTRR